MNITERHEFITRQLEAKGEVSVTELSMLLNVSEVTIRKDLTLLEKNNVLYRAHGKAIKISPYINDRDVNVKERQFPAEKTAIARRAVQIIEPNDSIIIASGTTVQYFAHEIRPEELGSRLTVITSALNVASILAHHRDIELIQLGGIVRSSSLRPWDATRSVSWRISRAANSSSVWMASTPNTDSRPPICWRQTSTA